MLVIQIAAIQSIAVVVTASPLPVSCIWVALVVLTAPSRYSMLVVPPQTLHPTAAPPSSNCTTSALSHIQCIHIDIEETEQSKKLGVLRNEGRSAEEGGCGVQLQQQVQHVPSRRYPEARNH